MPFTERENPAVLMLLFFPILLLCMLLPLLLGLPRLVFFICLEVRLSFLLVDILSQLELSLFHLLLLLFFVLHQAILVVGHQARACGLLRCNRLWLQWLF